MLNFFSPPPRQETESEVGVKSESLHLLYSNQLTSKVKSAGTWAPGMAPSCLNCVIIGFKLCCYHSEHVRCIASDHLLSMELDQDLLQRLFHIKLGNVVMGSWDQKQAACCQKRTSAIHLELSWGKRAYTDQMSPSVWCCEVPSHITTYNNW